MKSNDIKNYDEEIDLKELIIALWNSKIFIIITSTFFILSSVIYSLSLPNIYKSNAILIPANQQDTISSSLGSLSSLANISGINLASSTSNDAQEAIARIKSYDFFSIYFIPNVSYQNIVATKKWDSKSNIITYDDNLFDTKTNKWIDSRKPSLQEAYEEYKNKVLISQDNLTQFITISVDHHSPTIAKKWLDIIILNINESMRDRDKKEAQNAVTYLKNSYASTEIQSIREVISKLLENQIQVLMLAASKKAYVLEILESPIIPEKKSMPSRSLICIIGGILGIFFSSSIVLVRHYLNKNNSLNVYD